MCCRGMGSLAPYHRKVICMRLRGLPDVDINWLQSRRQELDDRPRRDVREPAGDEHGTVTVVVRLEQVAGETLEEDPRRGAGESADPGDRSHRSPGEHV